MLVAMRFWKRLTLMRGRQEDEQEDAQSSESQIEKAAERVGAERRRDVCVRGVA